MAINPFMLSMALTESASASYDTIPAYEFGTDNLDECTADMNFRIMSEAADMHEILVSTDELLAETSLTNPSRVDALNESIFSTIRDGVKKFFDKIISMVKGIIEKLKAFFYKMTKKTDKWASIMESKIKAAQKQTGYSDFAAEMYTWDEDYVNGGIGSGIKKLVDQWRSSAQADEKDTASVLDGIKKGAEVNTAAKAGMDADSDKTKQIVSTMEANTNEIAKELETFNKGFADTVGGAFGVRGSSLDVVYGEITKMAHKGGTEKTHTKFGGKALDMLETVKGTSKAISDLKTAYEEHLKHLSDFRKSLESTGSTLTIEGEDKIPAAIVRAAGAQYKAKYDKMMKITSSYETAMGSIRQLNINLAQSMANEYMTLLTKFAGFKGKKD